MIHSNTTINDNSLDVNIDRKTVVKILDAVNKMQQYMIRTGKNKIATQNCDVTVTVKIQRKHWVCTETVTVKNEWAVTVILSDKTVAYRVDVPQLEDILISLTPIYSNVI